MDVDELTLVCMLVHRLHSVWVALNTTQGTGTPAILSLGSVTESNIYS